MSLIFFILKLSPLDGKISSSAKDKLYHLSIVLFTNGELVITRSFALKLAHRVPCSPLLGFPSSWNFRYILYSLKRLIIIPSVTQSRQEKYSFIEHYMTESTLSRHTLERHCWLYLSSADRCNNFPRKGKVSRLMGTLIQKELEKASTQVASSYSPTRFQLREFVTESTRRSVFPLTS